VATLQATAPQTDAATDTPLLEVDDLRMYFPVTEGMFIQRTVAEVKAVDGVSFSLRRGETLGLVGESGCGKTTLGRIVMGLTPPSGGEVHFDGARIDNLSENRRRPFRARMQMVFQNPYSSLNGRMKIYDIIAEPIIFHRLTSVDQVKQIVGDLLDHVGLGRQAGRKYPHEFSGGQRQRISIARALASRPRLLIFDEPTSALDVSVQAQILNLLRDLQDELGLTMLFISHDLPVIRQMCDHVAIMRHGKILETAESERFFEHPQDPYSGELLNLMPRFDSIYKNSATAAVTE